MTDRMRTLREWYRYLDQQARLVERLYSGRKLQARIEGPAVPPRRPDIPAPPPERTAAKETAARPVPSSPGRPRLERNRRQVLHRLLDPEVTLHEAALLLSVSKSTLRRYTDSGRLPSFRSPGGQRRFHLSELLAFVEETRAGDRRSGPPRPLRRPARRGSVTHRSRTRRG